LLILESLFRIQSSRSNTQTKRSCRLKREEEHRISIFSHPPKSYTQLYLKPTFLLTVTLIFAKFVSANLTDLQICLCIYVKNITYKDIVVQIAVTLSQKPSKLINCITALRKNQFANFANCQLKRKIWINI
jgi:hypothetical protein